MVPPTARPTTAHTGASPEYVVRVFLEGLRELDVPASDDGYRTAYNLVTPEYRERVGSLEEFKTHLQGPFMESLVGHRTCARGILEVNDAVTEATQQVLVTDDEGDEYRYDIAVEKRQGGRFEGCWLVRKCSLVMDGEQREFQHMPTVEYEGQEIKCQPGESLRAVIRRTDGLSPHNGSTDTINCSGSSLCGTCAVEIVAAADEAMTEPSGGEARRLGLPPFRGSDVPNLRLACQTAVSDDVRVRKHDGRMGQKLTEIDDGSWMSKFLDGEPVHVEQHEV